MALALRSLVLAALALVSCGSLASSLFAQSSRDSVFYVARVGTTPAENRILAALEDETTLELRDTPLADVAALLSDFHDIPIMIDINALEDIGFDGFTPVSIEIRGVALCSALHLMLKDLDLDYIVDNGVLQITTKEVADTHHEIRIYDVPKMFPTSKPDSQQLATLISQTLTGTGAHQVFGGAMMGGMGFGGGGMGGGGMGGGGMGGMPGGMVGGSASSGPQIMVDGSLLVVRATLDDQQKVAEFLLALVRMKEGGEGQAEGEKAEDNPEE